MSMTDGMKGFVNVGISQMMDALDFCHKQGMDYESAKQHAAVIAMYVCHTDINSKYGNKSASEITHGLKRMGKNK